MSGPSISLDLRVGQRLEQRPVLSLQTIQSLKLLQMGTLDLQEMIGNEMLENPTLEMSAEDPPEAPTELEQQEAVRAEIIEQQAPELTTEAGASMDEVFDFLQKHTDFDEYSPRTRAGSNGEPDGKQEAFNNVATPSRGLAEHLLEQLRLQGVDELDLPLLEEIVYSLDYRGYLTYPLEDVVKALDGRYTLEEAEWALRTVQGLEPRGVGARSLSECLLLQVGQNDPDYEQLKVLLTRHWDDVLKNRVPRIAKEMRISHDEVKLLIDMLGALNPQPGSIYNETPTQIVTPDVIVQPDGDGFAVRLTRENLPRLSISPYYLHMLEKRKVDKEALNFVKTKVNHAKQLIEALQQRQSTLERVANSIVRRQEDYLRWGMSGLKPMKMQDIADELGIHHSTVWRAVYSKYMQTPHGIVAMNDLFTGGLPKDDGETSREAVKLRVKEIVDGEGKRKPLSDMAIAKLLADAGIQASRRVVTKYREELGIPDSRVRRQH
jgi:RNA polymerase sigma-54 factor